MAPQEYIKFNDSTLPVSTSDEDLFVFNATESFTSSYEQYERTTAAMDTSSSPAASLLSSSAASLLASSADSLLASSADSLLASSAQSLLASSSDLPGAVAVSSVQAATREPDGDVSLELTVGQQVLGALQTAAREPDGDMSLELTVGQQVLGALQTAAREPDGDVSLELTVGQQVLGALLAAICLGSIVAGLVFADTLHRYRRRFLVRASRTAFDTLLLVRVHFLEANVLVELALFAIILCPCCRLPRHDTCYAISLLSAVSAFTITYVTMWLSLVRLLLLAVARWAPRHGWRITNRRIFVLILMLYAPSAAFFTMTYKPGVFLFVCAGLPIENRPSASNTALGVLFLISTAANTLLLYADATLPPAPPRHRNVLSARQFALFTMCQQLMVLLWVPTTALTTGVTRALLIRVLMIGQAGLMDTLGLALLSPQLRAVLLGRQRRPSTPRGSPKVAPVIPIIRLELI